MASQSDSAHERTEHATPKRQETARQEGRLPRSAELTTAAVVLAGASGLHLLGRGLGGNMSTLLRGGLSLTREQALSTGEIAPQLAAAMRTTMHGCAPLFGLVVAAALLAPLALGGWNFTPQALVPNFTRLSPQQGFARMLSVRGLVELGKSLAKFAVVALIAVWVLSRDTHALLALGREPLNVAIGHALALCADALLFLASGLLLIAAVDVPFQLWQHAKQLRMSREEIREEMKDTDGSPEVKNRIRSLQQAIAKRRMMHEVPTADVVVVNPTHYAVALRYDENRMRAPRVVAKGVDLIAARIRELASEHRVPVFEAAPLARALYRGCDIGAEVPAALYVAVAQVLSYVFQLRDARRVGAPPPPPPSVAEPVPPVAPADIRGEV
jgi:flagellar biosynthesis protein FlhB